MKRTERIFTAALLGLALFGSCTSQTDEPTIGEALQISVVAQGFASGDAPATRTADAGYTTGFVAGDEIGITVIASDGASILHNNVRSHTTEQPGRPPRPFTRAQLTLHIIPTLHR